MISILLLLLLLLYSQFSYSFERTVAESIRVQGFGFRVKASENEGEDGRGASGCGHASTGRNDMLNACLRTLTGWGGSAVRAGAMRRLESGQHTNHCDHDTVN